MAASLDHLLGIAGFATSNTATVQETSAAAVAAKETVVLFGGVDQATGGLASIVESDSKGNTYASLLSALNLASGNLSLKIAASVIDTPLDTATHLTTTLSAPAGHPAIAGASFQQMPLAPPEPYGGQTASGNISGVSGSASVSSSEPVKEGDLALLVAMSTTGGFGAMATPAGWSDIGKLTAPMFACFYRFASATGVLSAAMTLPGGNWAAGIVAIPAARRGLSMII